MNIAVQIAFSHLRSRPRQTIVSLLGIVLGVAFFLAVSALMQGSENDFMKRLVDTAPHVTVYDEFREPRRQAVALAFPHAAVAIQSLKPRTEIRGIRQYKDKLGFVSGLLGVRAAPVLTGQAIVTYAGKDLGVVMNGVVPDLMQDVSTIDEHFLTGSLLALTANPNGIIIGVGLADKLRAAMGDNLTVTSPQGGVRTMKVVGLFRTGTSSYDDGQSFVLLKRAQNLLNRSNTANRFIIKLDDPARAPLIAHRVESSIGYKAQSWQESNEDLMALVRVRKIIMYSVVSAILVVASFGIYNVISTVVLEKTRDIAILKSIGFHARDIRLIFLIEGGIVGTLGSIIGTLLGFAMMSLLGQVRIKTPFYTGETFLPIYWGWEQVVLAVGFALLSALGAAYFPARKGGRLQPVDILRGAG